MLEKKAEDVALLSVGGLTSVADYFVLATAQSDRQVRAIAQFLAETLKHEGHQALSVEGADLSHWMLLDYGNVVAHVFYAPAREYYDLDGLWADAPRVEVQDLAASTKAAGRRKAAASAESD
jgi:ribosome-associated protein